MKLTKTAIAAIGAVSLFGLSFSASAGVMPEDTANAIQAEVLPTPNEARTALQEVGRQLHDAEVASSLNPAADRDYVAAWHAYQVGSYDVAIAQVRATAAEISPEPNWLDQNLNR